MATAMEEKKGLRMHLVTVLTASSATDLWTTTVTVNHHAKALKLKIPEMPLLQLTYLATTSMCQIKLQFYPLQLQQKLLNAAEKSSKDENVPLPTALAPAQCNAPVLDSAGNSYRFWVHPF